MPNKPEILTVAEFRKMKGIFKKPVVVYFNASQWANLTRDMKPVSGKPPKKTLTLAISEIPGLPGGFGTFGCPPECSRMTWEEGRGRCECAPGIPSPGGGGGGGGTPREFCFMLLRGNGAVTCVGKCSDPKRSCGMGTWRVPGSRIVMFACSCR